MKIFQRAIALLAILVAAALPGTDAQAERFKMGELHPEIRSIIVTQLKKMGVEPNNQMSVGITTSDCPSDCSDKVAGGMCLCKPATNCDEKGGTVTQDGWCRVSPETASVGGGGLSGGPLEIQTGGF